MPLLWVERLHARVGEIAARFYGQPARALRVIGVTGTNGKTSTVQMLAQALTLLGHRPATIGTLGAGLYGQLDPGERTTPDAVNVQPLLAEFRDAGASSRGHGGVFARAGAGARGGGPVRAGRVHQPHP